jgi:hypothetical protein
LLTANKIITAKDYNELRRKDKIIAEPFRDSAKNRRKYAGAFEKFKNREI